MQLNWSTIDLPLAIHFVSLRIFKSHSAYIQYISYLRSLSIFAARAFNLRFHCQICLDRFARLLGSWVSFLCCFSGNSLFILFCCFCFSCYLVLCIQSGDDLTVKPKDNDNDDDDDDDHRREMMMRSSIESLANVKRLQNVANKLDGGASTKLLTNFEHLERSSAQKTAQYTIAYSRWIRIIYNNIYTYLVTPDVWGEWECSEILERVAKIMISCEADK